MRSGEMLIHGNKSRANYAIGRQTLQVASLLTKGRETAKAENKTARGPLRGSEGLHELTRGSTSLLQADHEGSASAVKD